MMEAKKAVVKKTVATATLSVTAKAKAKIQKKEDQKKSGMEVDAALMKMLVPERSD